MDTDAARAFRRGWGHLRSVPFWWGALAIAATCVGAVVAIVDGAAGAVPVGAYALLAAVGVLGAVSERQRRATARAVIQERRRIARELHDGLAQELAYIRMETMRMAALDPGGRGARLALAAEHALDESRGAIAALYRDSKESFSVELSQVAEQLAGRAGARLRLEVDPGVEVHEEIRAALLRIVREAITNGVRHGHATEVSLELTGGDSLRIAVRDNGAGFVPGGPRRRGSFGLTSMRERAEALGGDLTVRSRPGEGTLVEVVLP